MAEFGKLGKGRTPPDKPLQALRYPAQTRYDGKIFSRLIHRGNSLELKQRIFAGPVGLHSRNIYCSILIF